MPKVFLLSDQPVLLIGFEYVLREQGFDIVGRCESASFRSQSALATARGRPDAILLDITAGPDIHQSAELHECVPECPVVLWADALPLESMFKTLEFGVRDWCSATSAGTTGGIAAQGSGGRTADRIRRAHGRLPNPAGKFRLTPREREIVSFLRQGMRNKQIAGEMGITEGTVKIYLFRLFHKLGVRNRFELARCGTLDQLQLTPLVQPVPLKGRRRYCGRTSSLM